MSEKNQIVVVLIVALILGAFVDRITALKIVAGVVLLWTLQNQPTVFECIRMRFRCELRSRQPDRVEVHGDQPTQSVQGAPVPGRSDRFMRTLVSPLSALLRARRRTGGRTWCRGGCQLHLALGAGLCT